MKITIKGPIKKKVITDTYKVSSKCMHGDADGYSDHYIYIKPENEEELFKIVAYLKYAQKNGDREGRLPRRFRNMEDTIHELHPGDYTADHQFKSSLQSWNVTYFDNDGTECAVTVQEEISDLEKGSVLEESEVEFLHKMDWYKKNLTVEQSIAECENEIKTKNMNVKKRQRLISLMKLNEEPINVVEFFEKIL